MKKWTAWLLFICLMTSLLSGCGGNTPSQPESASSAAPEASEPASAPEATPAQADESIAEAAESVQAGLNPAPQPHTDTPTFTVYNPSTWAYLFAFKTRITAADSLPCRRYLPGDFHGYLHRDGKRR